ncbi:MAG: stalk domain-containing protein, partial [Clostridia bacterium]|nr:stalk domain-containing protein [Clostridia bacterium]
DAAFGYMATGLGEGTGIFCSDYFKWVGGSGVDGQKLADLLNNAGLEGVYYTSETRGQTQGVRLNITDYHKFNPCRSGYYMLAYARIITGFTVPQSDINKSGSQLVMFDKIMGSRKIGQALLANQSPQEIEAAWAEDLAAFKLEREKYLIYGYADSSAAATEKSLEVSPDSEIIEEAPEPTENIPATPAEEIIPEGIKVYYENELILFDTQPYIDKNNRTIVPIRAIAEALGADVEWDPVNKKASFSKENNQVVFTIGQLTALVNGQSQTMDTIPVIKDGRTMIPLRYVSEYLGATVNWDDATKTVSIS